MFLVLQPLYPRKEIEIRIPGPFNNINILSKRRYVTLTKSVSFYCIHPFPIFDCNVNISELNSHLERVQFAFSTDFAAIPHSSRPIFSIYSGKDGSSAGHEGRWVPIRDYSYFITLHKSENRVCVKLALWKGTGCIYMGM